MKSIFAVLALGGVATATANPVTKVIELIKEMQSKIQSDGVAEEKTYNKYACWCEKTTDRKAAAIEQAKKDIAELGNKVLSLKGKVATLEFEIEKLTKDIAKNEETQAKKTEIREREAADYAQEKAEMEQTINALERAVKVLSGAGTGKKESLIALSASQKSSVHAALALAESFSSDEKASVRSFLESGAKYSPQSETVTGILKDMYATFTTNLESNTKDDMKSQAFYEEEMATLEKEHKLMSETKLKKEGELADTQQTLADTEQNLEDTTNQMNDDAEFFDNTKKQCKNKSDEWDERKRLRAEELSGISEALKILDTEEARKMFDTSIKAGFEGTSFVQINAENAPLARASHALERVAVATKSLRLAALAAKVHTQKSGHFGKVLKAIDDMIAELDDEEKDDADKRDTCTEKTHTKSERKAVLVHKIERNVAKITKLNSKLKKIVQKIEDTTEAKEEAKKELKEMTQTRSDEHDEFQQSKSDDEAAIKLLEAAIGKLSSYAESNAIDTGALENPRGFFLQLSKTSRNTQEPEFEVSEDQAPEAAFSGKDDNKQQGKGIVSMLTMIKEDLELEVSNGVKAEMAAQTAFEEAEAASLKLIASLKKQITNLEDQKATTETAISDEEEDKKDNEGLRDTKQEELDTIKPGCDWMQENFSKRRDMRRAEREGLEQAKAILSGAQMSLLKKAQIFDDSVLPSLEFRGSN
jgi:predicted  nucleic acid-binding Zn-ribbon protein